MTIRVWDVKLLPQSARKPRVFAQACRAALGTSRAARAGEINIVFLERKRMRALNQAYLSHSHDTDVIAFPYRKSGRSRLESAKTPQNAPFGDIFISAYQARKQARALGHSLLREAAVLTAHGALHLMGWDDQRPKERALMFRRQDQIVKALRL